MGRRKLKSQEQLFLAPLLKSPRHNFFKQLKACLAEAVIDPGIEQRCLPNSHRLRRRLQGIRVWCRSNRHLPLGEEHNRLSRKLRGHDAYYCITRNQRSLQAFREQVRRIWMDLKPQSTRSDRQGKLCPVGEALFASSPPDSPLGVWSRSEPVTRGTGCVNCARPGLWEPGASNRPGPPSQQGNC